MADGDLSGGEGRGELKEHNRDYSNAVTLYMKAGLPAKAARILMTHEVSYPPTSTYHHLVKMCVCVCVRAFVCVCVRVCVLMSDAHLLSCDRTLHLSNQLWNLWLLH